MTSIARLLLAWAMLMVFSGCGGGRMPAPTPVGIVVKATPANQTAYSGQMAPNNQVSFAALVAYSDGSFGSTPVSGAQWVNNDNWVLLQGNTATCLQAAPVIVLPAFSTVTATATVNGKTYTDSSGLYCL